MTDELFFSSIGLVTYLIGNLIASVWWASKVTTTLEFIKEKLNSDIDTIKSENVKRELEIRHEAEKRESEIRSIWKRFDDMRELVSSKILEHQQNCPRGGI